jgi:HEPN domain-containing protein
MSLEKYRIESTRWLQQAEADLRAARSSLAASHHEWAAFQSQQAGEKALKALWLALGKDPWGHSLLRLVRDFPESLLQARLTPMLPQARELDKLYVPTRYPNGLPDLTPAEVYSPEDAERAIQAAEQILRRVRELWEPLNKNKDESCFGANRD